MKIVVQKYGGTSVADTQRIMNVAKRAVKARKSGNDVVVVVSALGDTTDRLIQMAHEITTSPPEREMDMLISTGEQISVALLAMAIHTLGQPAISFTGAQVGIITDSSHTKARIIEISSDKIIEELKRGKVVIVAGFQGIDLKSDITTLGRGGSDTTAVALASVLKACFCEIYTDVDGVFTADPRIVPDARKIDKLSYDEMLELASLGANVLQYRCIEFAKKYQVPLHVRSSFHDGEGTIVVKEDEKMLEKPVVRGVTVDTSEAKVTISRVPDTPGIAARICRAIADANINIDMIVQNVSEKGFTDISFTVQEAELSKTIEVMENVSRQLGASGVKSSNDIAKLSVVGVGMRSHSGVAAEMFEALADKKINIDVISTSEIKISCLIEKAEADKALRAVHTRFRLADAVVYEGNK